MFENLRDIDEKLSVLEHQLSDPQLANNQKEYQEVVREHSTVSKLAVLYDEYTRLVEEQDEHTAMIRDEDEDPDLVELAKAELEEGKQRITELETEIRVLLLPKDPNDEKNIFLEIEYSNQNSAYMFPTRYNFLKGIALSR